MNKILVLCLIVCSGISEWAVAQTYKTEKGEVEFFSEASVESFSGKSNKVIGQINLADSTVDFYVDTNTLETGIKLRDEHMRENHLNTEEFPFIEFFGKLNGFDPAVKDTQRVSAVGNFTLRGVTKEIKVDAKAIMKGYNLYVFANWKIKLQDYNIPRPEFLFLKLSEEQKISLKVNLIRK